VAAMREATATLQTATRDLARVAQTMDGRARELIELTHRHPPTPETRPLAFLLDEFSAMLQQLEARTRDPQLTHLAQVLGTRVQELSAATSRNAEVVRRVQMFRGRLLLMVVLLGLLSGIAGVLIGIAIVPALVRLTP
jgi:hypothetical protein